MVSLAHYIPPNVTAPLPSMVRLAIDSPRVSFAMDIGRNEPCPCGSGKKYKRCCGATAVSNPLETAARALRTAQDIAESKVLRFIRQEFGEDAIDAAAADFGLPLAGPRAEDVESQLFLPWMLYDWRHELAGAQRGEDPIAALPAARRFLLGQGHRLSDSERRFLEAASATPVSFHEILDAEPGRSLRLRDVILGSEVTAFEQSGSQYLRTGDLTFARVVAFAEFALIVGCGSLVLPPIEKVIVLDLRASLRKSFRSLTPDLLRRLESQLRVFYFMIRERRFEPAQPNLCNTDGDPIELHTLTYRIDDPEFAATALVPLADDMYREDLLADAKRAWDGTFRASFPWIRAGKAKRGSLPNTTLANFAFRGTKLTVDANSARRAKAVRVEISTRLGERATFLRDDVQSTDDAMAEHAGKPETARERIARKRNEELQARPEVQAMLAKFNADHYSTWPDIPLPALKGKTPKAAMRTADGRERVEALIADFERLQDDGKVATPRYDFNQLRGALGLPRRATRSADDSLQ